MDYLRTFGDGFAGFDSTDEAFEEMFGRDLDEETDYIRENSLLVTKNWASYSLNMQALWYDNIMTRQTDAEDTTLVITSYSIHYTKLYEAWCPGKVGKI